MTSMDIPQEGRGRGPAVPDEPVNFQNHLSLFKQQLFRGLDAVDKYVGADDLENAAKLSKTVLKDVSGMRELLDSKIWDNLALGKSSAYQPIDFQAEAKRNLAGAIGPIGTNLKGTFDYQVLTQSQNVDPRKVMFERAYNETKELLKGKDREYARKLSDQIFYAKQLINQNLPAGMPLPNDPAEEGALKAINEVAGRLTAKEEAAAAVYGFGSAFMALPSKLMNVVYRLAGKHLGGSFQHLPSMETNPFRRVEGLQDQVEGLQREMREAVLKHDWKKLRDLQAQYAEKALELSDTVESLYPNNPAVKALIKDSPLDAVQYLFGSQKETQAMLEKIHGSTGGQFGEAAGGIVDFVFGPSAGLIKGLSGGAAKLAGKTALGAKLLKGSAELAAKSKAYDVAASTLKLGEGLAYYHTITTADTRMREKIRGAFEAAAMAPLYRLAGKFGEGTTGLLSKKLPYAISKIGGGVVEGATFGPGSEPYSILAHKLLAKIGVTSYDQERAAPFVTAMFERGDLKKQRNILIEKGRKAKTEKERQLYQDMVDAVTERLNQKEAQMLEIAARWGGTAFGLVAGSFVFPSEVADFRKTYPEAWRKHQLNKAAEILARVAGPRDYAKRREEILKTVTKLANAGIKAEGAQGEKPKKESPDVIQRAVEVGARWLKGKVAGWVKLKGPGGQEVEIYAGRRNLVDQIKAKWHGEGREFKVKKDGEVLTGEKAQKAFKDFVSEEFANALKSLEIMDQKGVFETDQEGIYRVQSLDGRVRRNSRTGEWELQKSGTDKWEPLPEDVVREHLGIESDPRTVEAKIDQATEQGDAQEGQAPDHFAETLGGIQDTLKETDPVYDYLNTIIDWAWGHRAAPEGSEAAIRRSIVKAAFAKHFPEGARELSRDEIASKIQDVLRELVYAEKAWAEPGQTEVPKPPSVIYEEAKARVAENVPEVVHTKAPKNGQPGRFKIGEVVGTYKGKPQLEKAIAEATDKWIRQAAIEEAAKEMGISANEMKSRLDSLGKTERDLGKILKFNKEVGSRQREESKEEENPKQEEPAKPEEVKSEESAKPPKEEKEEEPEPEQKVDAMSRHGKEGATTSFGVVFRLKDGKTEARVPTQREIIKGLEDLLGTKVETRRKLKISGHKDALGVHLSGKAKAIWTKFPDDVVTAAHEQGHNIYDTMIREAEKSMPLEVLEEMKELGVRLYGEKAEKNEALAKTEGFAEFFARLLFHKSDTFMPVQSDVPNLFMWFTDFLADKPRLAAKIQRLIEMGTVFSLAGIRGRIEQGGYISWKGFDTKFAENLLKRGSYTAAKRSFLKMFEHDWALLEEYEKTVEKKLGKELLPSQKPAYTRLALGNKSMGVANMLLTERFVDIHGREVKGAKSLKEILRPWADKDDKSKATRNKARNVRRLFGLAFAFRGLVYAKQGLDFPASAEELKYYVNELYREYKKAGKLGEFRDLVQSARDLSEFGKNITRYFWKPAVGLSTANLKEMDRLNPFYFPMQREFEESDIIQYSGVGGGKNTPRPIKSKTGSTRTVNDLLDNVVDQTYNIVGAAHRALIRNALVDLHEAMPNSELLTEVKPKKEKREFSIETILQRMFQKGEGDKDEKQEQIDKIRLALEEMQLDASQMLEFYKQVKFEGNPTEPVITVTRNGETKHYKVNDALPGLSGAEIYKTVMGHGKWDIGEAYQYVRSLKGFVQMGAVGLNMAFAVKNAFADALLFPMTTKFGNPALGLPRIMKAWFQALSEAVGVKNMKWIGSRRSHAFKLYESFGGKFDTLSGLTNEQSRRYLKAEILGWSGTLYKAFKKITELVSFGEEIPRSLEWENAYVDADKKAKAAMKEAMKLWQQGDVEGAKKVKQWSEMDKLLYSAWHASEVTVNFFRAGVVSRFVGQSIPFFTAQIAGISRDVRRLKEGYSEGPAALAKLFVQASSSVLALTWLEVLMGSGDERWETLPPDDYLHFFIFDTHIRIRLPHFLGFVFSTLPKRVILQGVGKDPGTGWDIVWQGLKELMPGADPLDILTPPVAAMIENFNNKDLRTGRPIVPEYLVENRPPLQQVKDTTSTSIELGVKLMKKMTGLEVSPAKVQHFLDKSSGGLLSSALIPVDWAVQGLGLADRRRRVSGVSIYGGALNPWYDNRYFALLRKMKELRQKHGGKTATREEELLYRRLSAIYRNQLSPMRVQWKEEMNGRTARTHTPEYWRKRVGKSLDRAIYYMNQK